MGRFYKTFNRWSIVATNKPAEVVPVKAEEVKQEAPKPAIVTPESLTIKKSEIDGKIVCEIISSVDCDEIRYNIGSRRVTEKNRPKCKLYSEKFELDEDIIINASSFKNEELICSIQG